MLREAGFDLFPTLMVQYEMGTLADVVTVNL